jgi:hypothetical protein
MCGIAGWVDWERDLTEERLTANAMNDTMSCDRYHWRQTTYVGP